MPGSPSEFPGPVQKIVAAPWPDKHVKKLMTFSLCHSFYGINNRTRAPWLHPLSSSLPYAIQKLYKEPARLMQYFHEQLPWFKERHNILLQVYTFRF